MMGMEAIVLTFGVAGLLIVARIMFLVLQVFTNNCSLHSKERVLRTIFCIGSGGHTTELLRIVKILNHMKYRPRLYIVADNDVSSEVKIHDAEGGKSEYALNWIPRSRHVGQSYLSSVFSTLNAIFQTIPVVYNFKPDVIICNGPGTCIPVCFISFLMRSLFILDCRIVFIESICRVRTMSLSGKILQYFADVVVVQWPQLRDVCARAKYFGRLS